MLKNYIVSIEDNGAAYLIVVNAGSDDRIVVGAEESLGDAWRKIKWMHDIESQEFFVKCCGRKAPLASGSRRRNLPAFFEPKRAEARRAGAASPRLKMAGQRRQKWHYSIYLSMRQRTSRMANCTE